MSSQDLSAFDGFPYILTRLVPAGYHILLLPKVLCFEQLIETAQRQVMVNRLRSCLVVDHDRCIYYDSDGTETISTQIPRGGFIMSGGLRPCKSFPWSQELMERAKRLEAFKARHPDGLLLGDLKKGGRQPTADEVNRLAGLQENGVPKGLVECPFCCEWKGQCIDPNPLLSKLLVPVHCLCENANFCAWCREYLYDRKLNANYYDRNKGDVIHVPGFSALGHQCVGIDIAAGLEDTCELRRERRETLIRRLRQGKATQETKRSNQTPNQTLH